MFAALTLGMTIGAIWIDMPRPIEVMPRLPSEPGQARITHGVLDGGPPICEIEASSDSWRAFAQGLPWCRRTGIATPVSDATAGVTTLVYEVVREGEPAFVQRPNLGSLLVALSVDVSIDKNGEVVRCRSGIVHIPRQDTDPTVSDDACSELANDLRFVVQPRSLRHVRVRFAVYSTGEPGPLVH